MKILKKLCEDTNTNPGDWEHFDGPETGVGIERWFLHKDGREAYTVDDQSSITVEVSEPEHERQRD
jgi:hypothetical protein